MLINLRFLNIFTCPHEDPKNFFLLIKAKKNFWTPQTVFNPDFWWFSAFPESPSNDNRDLTKNCQRFWKYEKCLNLKTAHTPIWGRFLSQMIAEYLIHIIWNFYYCVKENVEWMGAVEQQLGEKPPCTSTCS